jgi:CheY-like chemotaxis protein
MPTDPPRPAPQAVFESRAVVPASATDRRAEPTHRHAQPASENAPTWPSFIPPSDGTEGPPATGPMPGDARVRPEADRRTTDAPPPDRHHAPAALTASAWPEEDAAEPPQGWGEAHTDRDDAGEPAAARRNGSRVPDGPARAPVAIEQPDDDREDALALPREGLSSPETTERTAAPAETVADSHGARDPVPAAPRRGAGVVLLVEDEAPVRIFASRALRLHGFTVIEAGCAEDALRALADPTLAVDVFVTDVTMPGMDGPTWVRRALKDRPGVRVVFVSGYAEDSLPQGHAAIPESVFLAKPFSLDDLTRTVQRQLH